MNTISIIGRLTAIPELRHTTKGTSVCNGNIAVDDPYDKDKTCFFGITFFGRTADILVQYVTKGQKLGITGRLSQDVYTPPGAEKPVRKTHIVCDRFDFLERPRSAQEPAPQSAAQEPATEESDDIPF